MSTGGDPESTENLGANTDQDGAMEADRVENTGANTQEDGGAEQPRPAANVSTR